MFVLAAAMIPIVVVQVTATDQAVLSAAEVANGLIWLVFVAEYLYLLRRSADRWSFVRRRWLDLAVILLSPPFVVPVELASTRVLRLLRLVRLIAVLGRMHEGTRRATGRQGLVYVATVVALVVFMGGISIAPAWASRFLKSPLVSRCCAAAVWPLLPSTRIPSWSRRVHREL